MKEVWKDIKGYEGLYKISNFGRVKSLSRWHNTKQGGYQSKERILKSRINDYGYPHVTLCKNSKSKNKLIHRLIAIAFIPNKLNKLEVNHKNGIKYDYRICNLEWVTREENIQHAYKNGLMADQRIITKDDEIMIRKVYSWGYTKIKDLAFAYEVSRKTIEKVLKETYR